MRFWQELPGRADWFQRKATKQIVFRLRKELEYCCKRHGAAEAQVLLEKAHKVYGLAVATVALPAECDETADEFTPEVVRGTEHTLFSRSPVQEWNIYIDETGERCSTTEGGREGRVVAVCVRQGSTLPNLGAFHSSRKLLAADLDRPNYTHFCDKTTKELYVKPDVSTGNYGFGFNFPGEDKFYTNGKPQGVANIQRVGDKVEEMCGKVHVNQANNVMMMLSQSGVGAALISGIPQVNANSDEHTPVDFTLTKNDQTGAITIKYSSQESPTMPFTFDWTATVDVEGNVTTTPLNVTMKKQEQAA